jgi:hypothetical protein
MATHTLGALALPAGMIWTDEFDWRAVETAQEYAVTGALIIDTATRQAGRPITLEGDDDHGWLSRAQLAALYGLTASPDDTYTLTLADGRQFLVTFAPGGDPISARPIARPEIPPAEWPYVATLRLIEV